MSNSLLDEAFKCVEVIGYEKTLQVLKEAQFQEIKYENKDVQRVVELVAKKMNIPPYEIIFGSGRKNDRKYAIGFCAYYLQSSEFFNMNMEEVKDHLRKEIVLCYNYSKLIKKLNPNHISDKEFYSIKSEFDQAFAKKSTRNKN